MGTTENLQEAFAGESRANRTYLAFAKKAEVDGFPQVARLFRAAAEAETVHAHAHLRVLGDVKETAENLQAAMDGEGYEFQKMYPEFLAEAGKEGNRAAEITFRNALAVEEVHHGLYGEALKAINDGKDMAATSIFVCSVCGNTVLGEPPDVCPICNARRDKFFEVA
jgi:rubrerythrin